MLVLCFIETQYKYALWPEMNGSPYEKQWNTESIPGVELIPRHQTIR
jgi:hypothetical protein